MAYDQYRVIRSYFAFETIKFQNTLLWRHQASWTDDMADLKVNVVHVSLFYYSATYCLKHFAAIVMQSDPYVKQSEV